MTPEHADTILSSPSIQDGVRAGDVGASDDLFEGNILYAPAGGELFTTEQIIAAAVAHYQATGYPYPTLPVHVAMQRLNALAATPVDSLLRSIVALDVANTYHPHRLHASVNGKSSPVESFANPVRLTRALAKELLYSGEIGTGHFSYLTIVSGTQACANFRPGFALWMYRRFCQLGARVLDTSTGYGGRLVGFLASSCSHYLGIEPHTLTVAGNLRMLSDLGACDRATLVCAPIEDVDAGEYERTCDFAFTSPPYFSKEHYSDDETQSWKRYTTFEAWVDGFLLPMFAFQARVLRPGAISAVNIADVTIKKTTYPVVQGAKYAASCAGLDYVNSEVFSLSARHGEAHNNLEVAIEPVLFFRMPPPEAT